jgi:hypothetical protein
MEKGPVREEVLKEELALVQFAGFLIAWTIVANRKSSAKIFFI